MDKKCDVHPQQLNMLLQLVLKTECFHVRSPNVNKVAPLKLF